MRIMGVPLRLKPKSIAALSIVAISIFTAWIAISFTLPISKLPTIFLLIIMIVLTGLIAVALEHIANEAYFKWQMRKRK